MLFVVRCSEWFSIVYFPKKKFHFLRTHCNKLKPLFHHLTTAIIDFLVYAFTRINKVKGKLSQALAGIKVSFKLLSTEYNDMLFKAEIRLC